MFRILVRTIGIRFSILGQVNDGAKLARTLSLPMNHEIQWWIFDMELSTVFSLGIFFFFYKNHFTQARPEYH